MKVNLYPSAVVQGSTFVPLSPRSSKCCHLQRRWLFILPRSMRACTQMRSGKIKRPTNRRFGGSTYLQYWTNGDGEHSEHPPYSLLAPAVALAMTVFLFFSEIFFWRDSQANQFIDPGGSTFFPSKTNFSGKVEPIIRCLFMKSASA